MRTASATRSWLEGEFASGLAWSSRGTWRTWRQITVQDTATTVHGGLRLAASISSSAGTAPLRSRLCCRVGWRRRPAHHAFQEGGDRALAGLEGGEGAGVGADDGEEGGEGGAFLDEAL